jgi:hypothetical protein
MYVVSRKDGDVGLTDEERAILDFERTWWTLDEPKHGLIEERFSFSTEHYYRTLNGLLERDEALAHDPLVVRRLLRLRERRRRERIESMGAGGWLPGEAGGAQR